MATVSLILELLVLAVGYTAILMSNSLFEDKLPDGTFGMVIAVTTVFIFKAAELIIKG